MSSDTLLLRQQENFEDSVVFSAKRESDAYHMGIETPYDEVQIKLTMDQIRILIDFLIEPLFPRT